MVTEALMHETTVGEIHSGLSSQSFCEPKTALKIKSTETKPELVQV